MKKTDVHFKNEDMVFKWDDESMESSAKIICWTAYLSLDKEFLQYRYGWLEELSSKMNTNLKKEIVDWLDYQAKFADSVSVTELKMRHVFTDWEQEYKGKEKDKELILNNCSTVVEAYNFILNTPNLEINRQWVLGK